MRKLLILFFLLVAAPVWAQQPVVPWDPTTKSPIPVATTTEAQHDTALGTVTLTKFLLDGCRARDTVPSAVSTADDAVLGLCNLLGARAVFLMANSYGGADTCYVASTASTNSTNCKAQAATMYDFSAVNVTATLYYARLFNLSSAPTCNSGTGLVEIIPIPAATTGAGIVRTFPVGRNFSTGLGFCISAAADGSSNAAVGVYLSLGAK